MGVCVESVCVRRVCVRRVCGDCVACRFVVLAP